MNYTFDVNIGNKIINCRTFTLREYKAILHAKTNGVLEPYIIQLLKDCTNAKNLVKHEAELLLIHLWSNSLAVVNQEQTWVCDCGHEQQIPINLSHISYESTTDLVHDFGQFKIKFRYPGLFEDKNTAVMVASCIEYIITPDGEMLNIDDLNEAEIEDLYSAITVNDINDISAMLLKPQVQLAIPISCQCGKSSVHIVSGLKEFFKFL